jgi:hypothetical protein
MERKEAVEASLPDTHEKSVSRLHIVMKVPDRLPHILEKGLIPILIEGSSASSPLR